MSKPKLLDLFCGGGGAGMGYHRAGFEVIGVDLSPQKHYPFKFVQADALAYVAQYGWMYDAIHASPPCQAHSKARRLAGKNAKEHLDLIPQTRFWLRTIGLPYIIENVENAPLLNAITLCGSQFPPLKVYRHRMFETSFNAVAPKHMPHNDDTPPAGRGRSSKGFISLTSGGITGVSQSERFAAMGADWMTNAELNQSIPPAFTEYLGRQLMQVVVSSGLAVAA